MLSHFAWISMQSSTGVKVAQMLQHSRLTDEKMLKDLYVMDLAIPTGFVFWKTPILQGNALLLHQNELIIQDCRKGIQDDSRMI